MAEQRTLKKIQYDGKDVVVEVAKRDILGNQIDTTYATKSELSTGLAGKQDTLSEGTGIDITNNVVSLEIAGASQLGGVKVGSGLSITNAGVLSADAQAWGTITSKPFSSVSSNDFVVSSNTLTINDTKFATKSFVQGAYVALETYNTYVGTTAPTTYQAKITSDNKLSYSLISGTPTKLSDFTNDTGFITKAVSDLTNYYLKSETYTKSEVDGLISQINQFEYVVASELPTASASTMYKIYLIPSSQSATQNAKDEYITIRSGAGTEADPYTYAWEQIGSTAVDLTEYIKSSSTIANNTIVVGDGGSRNVKGSGKSIDSGTLANSSSTIPTSSAVYTAVGTKQDILTQASNAGNGITISNAGVIASVITATDVQITY